jgi:hypothetical protein
LTGFPESAVTIPESPVTIPGTGGHDQTKWVVTMGRNTHRFESEETRRDYMNLHPHAPKILEGSDAEDYVAEGFTWAVVP